MINKWGPAREGTKLLVLDVDHTLGDLCSGTFHFITHARPHLHEFLTRAYQYYDIAIWSAVDMVSLSFKLKQLRIMDSKKFRFLCTLDETEMATRTYITKDYRTKCLDPLWKEYPKYNKTNTIICDDQKANYLTNFGNGIEIRPYNYTDHLVDRELMQLAVYVEYLARFCDDLSKAKHSDWHDFTK